MPQAWLWKLVVVPESAVPGVEFECHGSDMEEKKQGEEMFLLLNTPPPPKKVTQETMGLNLLPCDGQ